MATVGKNILDNLTTGMYADSRVIYREYIQNACDQIDKAIKWGILDVNESVVDIFIDDRERYISIYDNATGVPAEEFIENLGDIANSNKQIGEDKGFRGIGRLCGLAYCKMLKFTSSAKGEPVKSVMICDAQKMRSMLVESKKYTLDEIWDAIIQYDKSPADIDVHFFEVELIDINKENTDLLDTKKVREYLSFVAPVPYKNTFLLRDQIYNYAKEIQYCIDEYCIKINGSQLFKEYTTRIKEQSGASLKIYDEISRLEFKSFCNESDEPLAWMWVGLSRFEKQIPLVNQMRGIRIRSANIQLGGDDALSELFKEKRGNYYFVGEVFCVSKQLIPNSQRNYFNENETRIEFEDALRTYFYDVLHKLYYDANRIKNDYKRQEEYLAKIEEYKQKESTGSFVDEESRQKMQFDIEKAKKSAEEARRRLDKLDCRDKMNPLAEVSRSIGKKYKAEQLKKKVEKTDVPDAFGGKKKAYVTANMSKLTRNERKIVGRILSIITDIAPKDMAEQLIEKIKEEFK